MTKAKSVTERLCDESKERLNLVPRASAFRSAMTERPTRFLGADQKDRGLWEQD